MKTIKMLQKSIIALGVLSASTAAFADSYACDVPTNLRSGKVLSDQPQYLINSFPGADGVQDHYTLNAITHGVAQKLGDLEPVGAQDEDHPFLEYVPLDMSVSISFGPVRKAHMGIPRDGLLFEADCPFVQE